MILFLSCDYVLVFACQSYEGILQTNLLHLHLGNTLKGEARSHLGFRKHGEEFQRLPYDRGIVYAICILHTETLAHLGRVAAELAQEFLHRHLHQYLSIIHHYAVVHQALHILNDVRGEEYGLDPGYRRLFVDYMREYAKAEDKTVFLTSHIIQDMERLVDDCIVMDYGKILVQMPVNELLGKFRRYTAQVSEGFQLQNTDDIYNPSVIRQSMELFSMLPEAEVRARLSLQGVADVKVENVGLEDAFIGLTGKY